MPHITVAGQEVIDLLKSERDNLHKNIRVESLTTLQKQQAKRGYIGVEIVKSIHGFSVRYNSGLQDFGIVAKAAELGGTLEQAESFCRDWVAQDPKFRYATIHPYS